MLARLFVNMVPHFFFFFLSYQYDEYYLCKPFVIYEQSHVYHSSDISSEAVFNHTAYKITIRLTQHLDVTGKIDLMDLCNFSVLAKCLILLQPATSGLILHHSSYMTCLLPISV